jgi:DNA-binding transcriptional ArsR family regulator
MTLDASSVKALAHPLRVQIVRALRDTEQATATTLAAALAETTGATSYHLRQLARHGFIEEVPRPGRERWWRLAVGSIHLQGFAYLARADTREATGFLLRESHAERTRTLTNWFATALEWPQRWQDASTDADTRVWLTPEKTRALADEIAELIDRYRLLPTEEDSRQIEVQYAVFPRDTGDRL